MLDEYGSNVLENKIAIRLTHGRNQEAGAFLIEGLFLKE
jgi:hypothetical protein